MDEERLIVALEARIRDFERNMQRAERRGTDNYRGLRRGSRRATDDMERDMRRASTRINQALAATSTRIGAVGKAFAAGAIALGIGAITTGSGEAIRSLAELEMQAKRAGLSVTEFQKLKFVAEQNRIEVDAMIDGIKEMQLRIDEFVVTGSGSASDAFNRLGFDAKDLAKRLEDPSELFLEMIDRLEGLDRAAQIRVADEVFGGSGGERFVELLTQGDEGIRQLMTRAEDLGLVLEESTIAKAVELDRKFVEITTRVSTLAKTIVVDLAGAIDNALTVDIDDIFGSAERAIAMMGEANYRAMKDVADITDDQRGKVEDLIGTYDDLFRAINAATGPDGIRLMDVADLDAAHDLAAILQDIDREMQAFTTGETKAAEFEAQVFDLVDEAQNLIGELNTVDAQRFGNVIGAISGIANALASAAAQAATLRANLPEGDTETAISYGPQNGRPKFNSPGSDTAPRGSLRPRLPSINASFGVPAVASGGGGGGSGGGGGGGGAAKVDDYQREIERTREDIAMLEAEATALAAVAASGAEYADALEYARKKAELLYEAQKAGKEITPQVEAEIDQLALAYSSAGAAADDADDAADRIDAIRDNAKAGAERMSDLFLGILDGSMTARDALKGLLIELAKVQIQKGILGLAGSGGGGFFGVIGGLLSGARAGGGPVQGGGAYLVNENTPNSEVFVPSQSGGILNVPQAQEALRGGGATPAVKSEPSVVELRFGPEVEAKILKDAANQTVKIVQMGGAAQRRSFGGLVGEYSKRGTIG